jgi:hypothetical protein
MQDLLIFRILRIFYDRRQHDSRYRRSVPILARTGARQPGAAASKWANYARIRGRTLPAADPKNADESS